MSSITSLLFIGILIALGFYGYNTATPYYLHETTPNLPMETVIGGKPWYFPMGYIDPHYPLTNGEYLRGGETELWLSIETSTFKIIPQDVAKQNMAPGQTIDVILTSDNSPQAKKAMTEMRALESQMSTFTEGPAGLKQKQIGDNTEYMAIGTHISCGATACTLFTTQIADLRTVIIFNRALLPSWSAMISNLDQQIQPFKIKPNLNTYFHSLIATQPVNQQRNATTPNSQLIVPGDTPGTAMPETTIPTLNAK